MDFARRVLRFDVGPETVQAYSPVPTNPHDDDELGNDEFERDYHFGANHHDDDADVDDLLNESDWLQLRGGAGSRSGAMWALVILNAAALGVEATLLYWYIREIAYFFDDMYTLSLLGVIVIGATALLTLSSLISLIAGAFNFVEMAHWSTILLLPLTVLYGLCMIFLWTDQAHTTINDEGEEVVIKGITKLTLCILVGSLVGLMVSIMIGNLAIPFEDSRKPSVFRWTIFSSCLVLLLGGMATAVFASLVLKDLPLLMTGIDGWSVYVAAIASLLLSVVMVAALACSRRALKAVLVALPVLGIPLLVADVINYYLSFQVPIDTEGDTVVSDNLLYATIISLSTMPFAVLAFGTACMWRRRATTKWPH